MNELENVELALLRPIEECRAFWADVAKKNNWYTEPFYVQVWLNPDGTIEDSVSTRALTRDVVIQLTEDDLNEMEGD